MKRKQDLIYLIALIVFTLLLFTSANAQFASEKYMVTIGTAGQYQPDSAGFKDAVTKAQKLSRLHNSRITIIVMPGVANIGNSFVILPDSVDWFWMPTVKITGSNATAVIKDTAAVTIKWAGAPEVFNTTDTTKKIVLDGATTLSYLYSVATDGDSTLNPLSIIGLASGHVLQWSGSTWENQNLTSAGIASISALDAKADTNRSYDKAMTDALISEVEAGTTSWGSITGTLSSQSDLNTALSAKFNHSDTSNYYKKAYTDALLTGKQNADADLTTYAGITPSANIQTLLGAADYSAMRTQLALVIGTNVQAYDPDLTTYAGITPSANIQTLLGAADYSAMRTQLALVIGTNVQAYDADLTTWAGITPSANVQTLVSSADYSAFKTSLGLNNVTNESKSTMFDDPSFTGAMGTEALYSDPVNLGLFTTAIDWKVSNVFYATCNSAREFTFTNTQEGQIITLVVILTDGDAVTFDEATLEWPDDTAPTSSTGAGRDVYTFMRVNGKIYGAQIPYIARTW